MFMKRIFIFISLILCILLSAGVTAPYVLLYDKETVTVNADGTYTVTDQCRYKVLNHDGVTKLRTLSLHFNSAYGSVKVTELAVVKADGRRIKIDPAKHSSVNTESSQLDSAIFDPAQMVLNVTVPELEAGDTLEVTSFENITKARLPGEFSDIAVLQADFPIEYYEYIVDMPAEKPLKSICIKDEEKGTVSFSEEKKDGRIIYKWVARKVPQAVPESAMPAMYTCIQRVLLSTVASWEDISRWYDKLCAPRLAKVNDNMRKRVAGLTAGKKSDMEKITALFQFVSQQIRYTGITDEDTAPGYEPHDVDQTFERRHGVCRDKAALLVAMLRIAGLKAHPVLFMSGTPKDKEVPNIYFNHAIAGVEKADGEYILMDPTFETTTELFPGYLAGDSFLAAKPEGDTLRTAPAEKAEDHLLDIHTQADIVDGVKITSKLNFSGIYDQMYRDAFSRWTKEDIRNFFSSRVRMILPDAELESVTVTPENIRDMSKELAVTLKYKAGGLFQNSGAPSLVSVPRGSAVFGLLESVFTHTGLAKRRFPLKALPRAVRESIRVNFDTAGFSLTLPEKCNLNEKGLFRMKLENFSGKEGFTENFFFAVDSMLISPEDYGKFKAAAGVTRKVLQTLPVISKERTYTADGADSEYLDHILHCDIRDAENMTLTRTYTHKLHNYSAVKEFANRTLKFTDGLEKLDVSAVVTNAQGKKFTLSPKEINIMDDKSLAAAPRYFKRKLAVISFPGAAPGSIIECTEKLTSKTAGFFSAKFITEDDTPVRHKELIIEHPAKMRLAVSPVPENVKDSSTFGGKRIIRRFSADNCLRRPHEPGQPDYSYFVPTVRISAGNLTEYYNKVCKTAQEKVDNASADIGEVAAKIAAKAPDILPVYIGDGDVERLGKEKMRKLSIAYALEKYIYTHIRDVDLPLNRMYFQEYSLPQTTLRDGYGNSVDKAVLLAAMLKSQNIAFEFIPATSTPAFTPMWKNLKEYPENLFTKLLLYLPEYECYLNDSGLYGTPGVLHSTNNIALNKDGLRILFMQENASSTVIFCNIDLAADLSAAVELKYCYHGDKLESEKLRFSRFTPELKKQYFEKISASISPEAKVVSAEFNGDVKDDYQLKISLQIPDFARRNGRFVTFALPEYDKLASLIALPAKKRFAPIVFSKEKSVDLNYFISVPENFKLCRTPASGLISQKAVAFNHDFVINRNGTVGMSFQLGVYPVFIQPSAFQWLLKIAGEINSTEIKNIIFTVE